MSLSLLSFSLVASWAALLLFRGRFWRCDQFLTSAPQPTGWPEIVAVIPARNEADTIEQVIQSHAAMEYPGAFSTILVDDQSDDATAALAEAAAPSHNLTIVKGKNPPEGWTGKVWAMQQGLEAANQVAPGAKYVLFTDADIKLAPDTVKRLVQKAQAENLALTSLMARLDMRGLWGGLLVPAFIYFFQKLYPFSWANDPDRTVAAAAGGVMLVRKGTLESAGAMSPIKGELIDDCALARLIKNHKSGQRIWIGLAQNEAISLRDNRELSSIWKMVTRTAYTQLRYSPLLLVFAVLAMAYLYLAPPLIALSLVLHGNITATFYALLAWALMAYSFNRTLRFYDHPHWVAGALPVAAALYLAMTIDSARLYWLGKGGQWKGRQYA